MSYGKVTFCCAANFINDLHLKSDNKRTHNPFQYNNINRGLKLHKSKCIYVIHVWGNIIIHTKSLIEVDYWLI